MVNLVEEMIKQAKSNKVSAYFDMDGCCAEYSLGKEAIVTNQKDYYLKSRPMKYIINIMRTLQENEVEVKILSNCYYNEQKHDKIKWLSMHAPFVKRENVNIIVYENETFTKEEKSNLKPNKLKTLVEDNEIVYFIEDDHRNIVATTKLFPQVKVYHISSLIE